MPFLLKKEQQNKQMPFLLKKEQQNKQMPFLLKKEQQKINFLFRLLVLNFYWLADVFLKLFQPSSYPS